MSNDYLYKLRNSRGKKPAAQINSAKKASQDEMKAKCKQNADTILRKELQNFIINLARDGKSIEEIVKTLNGMQKYSKFADFFTSYAEHFVSKMPKFKEPNSSIIEDIDER